LPYCVSHSSISTFRIMVGSFTASYTFTCRKCCSGRHIIMHCIRGCQNLADIFCVVSYIIPAGSSQFIHITAVWTACTGPAGTCWTFYGSRFAHLTCTLWTCVRVHVITRDDMHTHISCRPCGWWQNFWTSSGPSWEGHCCFATTVME
jgi:hypothetical protein